MASQRAAISLAKASAPAARIATPVRFRVAAHFASRQYHSQSQRQRQHQHQPQPAQLVQQPSASLSSLLNRTGTRSARAYSTDAAEKPHKIWDFEALQKLISTPNPSITIIDVREPHELQSTGRIPGALNIPLTSAADSYHITEEEFEDRFGYPRPARDAEVVFYCRAGVRSRAAAGLAKEAGFTKVGEYPGSWLDWAERGGRVEK